MARELLRTRLGGLVIVPEERRAFFGDSEIALTPREFDILARLVERPGWVLSPEQLCERAAADYSSPFAVNVHVTHLRAKLASAGAPEGTIETVRGSGWRLNPRRTDGQSLGFALADARAAFDASDFESARERLDEAERLLDESHMGREKAQRLESILHERRGRIRTRCGCCEDAYADYTKALARRPKGDHHARARLLTRVGWLCTLERRRGEASQSFAAALSELEMIQDRDCGWWRSWIEIRLRQLDTECITDMPAGCADPKAELGEHVRLHGTLAQKARYHEALASREYRESGYVVSDVCLEHQREAVRYAERSDSEYVHALESAALGSFLVFRRELREGEARLRESLDLCRKCGDRFGEKANVMFLSLSARYAQDVRRTEQLACELERMLDGDSEMPEFASAVKAQLAWVNLRRGEFEHATQLADEALRIWDADPSCNQGVWMMAWPAVACAVERKDVSQAFEYAALMLRADQCVLDDGVGDRLSDLLAAHASCGGIEAFEGLVALERRVRQLAYT